MPTLNAVLAGMVHMDRITAQDVIAIRRAIYPGMAISPGEAEGLFAINDTARSTAMEWRQMFVEALTDYLVRQQQPSGYVDEAQARWLAARITCDGRIKSETELDLLIHILETASQAPKALSQLAMDQVAAFAMTPERRAGEGPTLTSEEVRRLRRLLYAFAGDGAPGAISRREAEMLFALNDAARGRPNARAWRELFVQAIGATLLAADNNPPPSREQALHSQAWLEAPTDGVVGLLEKTLKSSLADGLKAMAEKDAGETRNHRMDAAIAQAERLTDAEACWLIGQIGRDGVLDGNEVALLQFVAREASDLSPALEALVDQARVKANVAQNLGQPPIFGRRTAV